MKICIDPGHAGNDSGAVGQCKNTDLCEHDITEQVSLYLEAIRNNREIMRGVNVRRA